MVRKPNITKYFIICILPPPQKKILYQWRNFAINMKNMSLK